MADEGIEFTLPAAVIDHVANTDRNLGFVRNKVKRHAREGVKEGDGLTMFKFMKVRVPTEEDGRSIIRTELMIIVKCKISDAHHALFRDLNQTTSTRLPIGVYTFDNRGCKYPDRTMSSLPVDVQQIRDRLQVNKSILNPIYIDDKEDRVRPENRPHLLRAKGGYPVEKLVGIADLTAYNPTSKTQRILSTPERPHGSLLVERDSSLNAAKVCETTEMQPPVTSARDLTAQIDRIVLSTPERPSGSLLEERGKSASMRVGDQSNTRPERNIQPSNDNSAVQRSALSSELRDRRLIITGDFYK